MNTLIIDRPTRTKISFIRNLLDCTSEKYEPFGKFYAEDTETDERGNSIWVAVDNSTGEAFTEDFRSEKSCIDWLNGMLVLNRYGEVLNT